MTKDNEDVAQMNFETALSALEKIVVQLESGDVGLEESIAIYTRGTALKKHCESKLQEAKSKIDKITLDGEGKPSGTSPLDV